MATVAKFVDLLAAATGEPFPTVRLTARQQADDDVQPKASGRRVPNITYEQAVMLLFAVMAAHPVKDATRTAKTYAALVHNGMPAGGETALEAVARLLRRLPKESSGLDWSLEVCMNFPQIVLKKKSWAPQMAHLELAQLTRPTHQSGRNVEVNAGLSAQQAQCFRSRWLIPDATPAREA